MFLGYDLLARRWVRYAYAYPFLEGSGGHPDGRRSLERDLDPGGPLHRQRSAPSPCSRRCISTGARSSAPASAGRQQGAPRLRLAHREPDDGGHGPLDAHPSDVTRGPNEGVPGTGGRQHERGAPIIRTGRAEGRTFRAPRALPALCPPPATLGRTRGPQRRPSGPRRPPQKPERSVPHGPREHQRHLYRGRGQPRHRGGQVRRRLPHRQLGDAGRGRPLGGRHHQPDPAPHRHEAVPASGHGEAPVRLRPRGVLLRLHRRAVHLPRAAAPSRSTRASTSSSIPSPRRTPWSGATPSRASG